MVRLTIEVPEEGDVESVMERVLELIRQGYTSGQGIDWSWELEDG